jgi:hypothetical protein
MNDEHPVREFASSTALMITGTDLVPADISAALDLEPDKSWRRGDAKSVGKDLHEWGGWRKRLQSVRDEDPFAAELRTWHALLSPRVQFLRELQCSGCRVVLDCFISVAGAALFEFDPQLQRDLAELGIDVTIAIWGSRDVD